MPTESVTAAQEYYCRLTSAGAALEAAAHAEGRPVVLTHVAVGDGGGIVPVPQASATALVNEVCRRAIDGREQDREDPNIAWLHVIIPAGEGGFWIREFGVYAEPLEEDGAPVLYAYGNHAPYYKQQADQGQATTHELSIPVILSGTAEVEISVKDAGYASQLALEDLRELVEADRQRLWENAGEGPKLLPGVVPLATQEAPGAVQPDGVTAAVDEDGLLSALGGNLLLNSEAWITVSGEWEAPVTGWYDILAINGGNGGHVYVANSSVEGGRSGAFKRATAYFLAGQSVHVVIGAGGIGYIGNTPDSTLYGGETTVEGVDFPGVYENTCSAGGYSYRTSSVSAYAYGGGYGAKTPESSFRWFGAGGGARYAYHGETKVSNGDPGGVCMRWHDPAKANGPAPEPALFSARRMAAPRAAAAPVTVNLYDPATGQGSVWREEDAEAKLAEGMLSEEAWLEICQTKAAEERAAWLVSPDTEAERFELLRQAREARLAATDYLVAADYPLPDEQRAAVTAWRQALRDLPAQEDAPWDGGGEETPWPDAPAVAMAQEADDAPAAS